MSFGKGKSNPVDEFPPLDRSLLTMNAPTRSTLVCDVESMTSPDLGSVGALARLQLEARRLGLELLLRGASSELRELIAFVGLEKVLCVETRRQPEEGEQRLRVEEERQLRDSPT